jgi:transcriptional regulator with XRE-family HTH domain
MASPDNLLSQLAERTATFLRHSGLTQGRLCRYLNVSDSSLSQFLGGTKGLDPAVLIRLCQVLSLSHRELETKFSAPVMSSKIMRLQESTLGQPARMRLDNSGWYPGTDGSGAGQDPNDQGSSIDDVPNADITGPVWDQGLIDTLREVRGIHRKAARAISDYVNRAKVNAGIVTPSGVSQKFSRR